MKEAFSLRTMHKKIVMLSKLAGIILIFSYILSAGLPVSEDLAFLIWLFFILLLIFNSRPHAEVDPDSYWTIDRNTSFNSRPHAEVDKGVGVLPIREILSTHDLTQRSTFISIIFGEVQNLSTHDLTQRSTVLWIFWHHLQIFQLTTSRRGRRVTSLIFFSFSAFNSRPHAEVDNFRHVV